MEYITMSKTEQAVMTAIHYEASKRDGSCLMKPIDLLAKIPYNVEILPDDLDQIIRDLVLDQYIKCDLTDKKGEQRYCFQLTEKGYAFSREVSNEKRSKKKQFIFRIMLTVSGTVVAAIVRLIIYAVGGK